MCNNMCREQESRVRREQEQLRMAIPRFETEAEKQERLKMEQELAEFGRVSEAFRLSNPNPRYFSLIMRFCRERHVLILNSIHWS